MFSVVAKPIGPISSYAVREDDGPSVECFDFKAEITINGKVYSLGEYDTYDSDELVSLWVSDTFPEIDDYDERRDLIWAIIKALDWVVDERGRW